jgi:arylsulfatase A-like enzyme
MRRTLFLLALIPSVCLSISCGGGGSDRPNVILVITDTVRADKLGCYGNTRGLTPRIDEFAGQGLRFANASSHAPWTLPSIATMLTGLHPAEHGAGGRRGEFTPLAKSVTTLPAVFQANGYRTHCVANVEFLKAWTGVTRDFEVADVEAPTNNVEMRNAGQTTDIALEWLDENGDQPFFLLVHYFDPHAVYDPPQPYRRRFAAEPDRLDDRVKFPTRADMIRIRRGELPPTSMIQRAEMLHDAEIAYLDSQVGRLLDELEGRGLLKGTVIALTADHGEEFLDHGGFEHGHQLYQELTHVPLILRAPGVPVGTIEATVGHVDLAATLCELVDLAPPEQFLTSGRSLLRYVDDPTAPGRPILAHGNMWAAPMTSWRVGDEKLIRLGNGSYQLFDLAHDAGEHRDLAASRPDLVAQLSRSLDEIQKYMHAAASGRQAELSPATVEALKASGYLGGDDDDE